METRMIVIMLILKRSALNKYLLIEVPLSEKIAFGRGVHTRWALAGQMTFQECVSLNITCGWSYNQKELGTYIFAKFNHMPFFQEKHLESNLRRQSIIWYGNGRRLKLNARQTSHVKTRENVNDYDMWACLALSSSEQQ